MRDVTLTFRPEDILVQGPARAQVRIAGAGTVPGIERLAADLETALGYDVLVELRVVPEEIQYYPLSLRPLSGNETDPVDTSPSTAPP